MASRRYLPFVILAATVSCGTPTPSGPSGVGKTCAITGGSWAFDGKGLVSLGRTVATQNRPTVTYVASGSAAPMQLTGPSCR